LSAVLFTKLLLPFEVTSVLILIAILGSVALARQGDGEKVDSK
jgi:NADH-quinone oxidoreductase subunit J